MEEKYLDLKHRVKVLSKRLKELEDIYDSLDKTADGVPIKEGMQLWEFPRHRGTERKSTARIVLEIRPCDYKYCYSTQELAVKAGEEADGTV